jgi:hypothetical protein
VIAAKPGRRKGRTAAPWNGALGLRSTTRDLSRQSMGACPSPPLARVRPPITGRYPKGLYDNV